MNLLGSSVPPSWGSLVRVRAMKRAVVALCALALAGCGEKKLDAFATLEVSSENVPAYEVSQSGSTAELIADTDRTGARQVAADYIDEHADEWSYASVSVIGSPKATTVLCRVEYVADETTAEGMGPRLRVDEYPALFASPC